MNGAERISAYLDKCPAAITGQNGSGQTISVACALVHGFLLSEADALHWLRIYNQKCWPPWSEKELIHKIKSTKPPTDKPRGWLTDGKAPLNDFNKIQRDNEAQAAQRLKMRAQTSLRQILENRIELTEFLRTSPYDLVQCNIPDDWRLILKLFKPDDVLWIGETVYEKRFNTVSNWLKLTDCPGNFTCPATFKPETVSRCNDSVLTKPFLVVESDSLTKEEILSVFQWLRKSLRLRAVVDTGGKSLHGWFDSPSKKIEDELRTILPQLECDKALFTTSQPCRLPGAMRQSGTKKTIQHLIWLDIWEGK